MLKYGLPYLLLLLSHLANAQCITSRVLWQKVEDLRAQEFKADVELKILADLQQQSAKCGLASDSAYSNLLMRFSAVHYREGNYNTAQEFAEEAINIMKLKSLRVKPDMLCKAYFVYGMILRENNNNQKASIAFDSSITYASVYPGNNFFSMLSYRNLAVIHYFNGDYQRSVTYAGKARLMARNDNDTNNEALAMCEEALALEAMKQYTAAEKTIQAALAKYNRALAGLQPTAQELEELGNLYTTYGNILRKLDKPHAAIDHFQKAFDIYQKLDYKGGSFIALNNIGFNYLHVLRDFDKAESYFRKSFKYTSGYTDSIHLFTNLGDVLAARGKYDDALRFYQQGLNTIPASRKFQSIQQNPNAEWLANCSQKEYIVTLLGQKATAWTRKAGSTNKKYLEFALETFSLADKVIDQMIYQQESTESKVLWREKAHSIYEQAIEVCHRLKDSEKAFFYFEKSRALVLNQELSKISLLMERSRNVMHDYAVLTRNLNTWKREIAKYTPQDPEYHALFNKIFAGTREVELTLKDIRKSNPNFYNAYFHNAVMPVSEVRKKLLDDHRAVIEIFEGDSAVYVFSLSRNSMSLRKLNKAKYDELVERFISLCSSASALNKSFSEFTSVSNSLYHLLFTDQAIPPGRIIISPDSRFIPFEALITGFISGRPIYLVEQYAVSYAFSVKLLTANRVVDQSPGNSFLGLAPVQYASNSGLASLVNSDISMRTISGNFDGSRVYLNEEATRSNFLKQFANYQVIQLYTHAAENSDVNEPVIYFADSALYLSDLVIDQPISAELVVLSACETALGKVNRGEGVFSFSRGFAALGIPSSMANLWEVDNEAMYSLTQLFYQYLAEGSPKDIAMQKAKLEFLRTSSKEKTLPYFWAASILAGKSDPLTERSRFAGGAFGLYAGTAIAFAGLFLIFSQKHKRRNKKASNKRDNIRSLEAGII